MSNLHFIMHQGFIDEKQWSQKYMEKTRNSGHERPKPAFFLVASRRRGPGLVI